VRKGDNLEDPGVDRRIILKWIFEKWDGGIDRIDPGGENLAPAEI
jgi:hypothetical protein